jgi:hypothetical protein
LWLNPCIHANCRLCHQHKISFLDIRLSRWNPFFSTDPPRSFRIKEVPMLHPRVLEGLPAVSLNVLKVCYFGNQTLTLRKPTKSKVKASSKISQKSPLASRSKTQPARRDLLVEKAVVHVNPTRLSLQTRKERSSSTFAIKSSTVLNQASITVESPCTFPENSRWRTIVGACGLGRWTLFEYRGEGRYLLERKRETLRFPNGRPVSNIREVVLPLTPRGIGAVNKARQYWEDAWREINGQEPEVLATGDEPLKLAIDGTSSWNDFGAEISASGVVFARNHPLGQKLCREEKLIPPTRPEASDSLKKV